MFQNILNEYILKDTIGKGSFSKVKLGINKITGEKVAIKILDKKKIKLNSERIRIQRELNILKKLNHINIVKIYQIKEDTNNIYIIQEYIENNLFIHILNKKHFTEKESSFYFYQIIKGLEYIHSLNIVHRDLKPENILITKNNLLKIIDFGLSNYYYNDKELLSTSCGSPSYTAPEVISGNKYNGFKSDIWSIGIILYFMLCGNLPFDEINDINNSLYKKIIKCKIEYPNYISINTKNLLKKILVVDPDQRINLIDIKKHQFYINGKKLFFQKFPELINNKLEEHNNINNKNYNNTIPCNKNKLNIDIKKIGPNFDLLKKILKGVRSNNNTNNNKKENKEINNNKNNEQIKLLYKLNKEKEIYEKKYLLTELEDKKNNNYYNNHQKIKTEENKNNISLTLYKKKRKYKNKNKSLDINNSIDIITRNNYDNYMYNNSEIIINRNKNLYYNSFTNRKNIDNLYENNNNTYTNKIIFKHGINLKLKINRKQNSSHIKYKLINSPHFFKEKRKSNLNIIKKIKINGILNKSENKRNKLNNISQIIHLNYKNNSYNKRKNKNEIDKKYNIKEIIKRRGLDKIIKHKN